MRPGSPTGCKTARGRPRRLDKPARLTETGAYTLNGDTTKRYGKPKCQCEVFHPLGKRMVQGGVLQSLVGDLQHLRNPEQHRAVELAGSRAQRRQLLQRWLYRLDELPHAGGLLLHLAQLLRHVRSKRRRLELERCDHLRFVSGVAWRLWGDYSSYLASSSRNGDTPTYEYDASSVSVLQVSLSPVASRCCWPAPWDSESGDNAGTHSPLSFLPLTL